MARVLFQVLSALLGISVSSCGRGPRPGPPNVYVPPPSEASAPVPAPAPAPRSTPFVEVPSNNDTLEALASGRVLVGGGMNVDVFEGGRLRQRADSAENWLEGGMYEVVTGHGEGPGGGLYLMTHALIAPPPPAQGAGYIYMLRGRAWIREGVVGVFGHAMWLSPWSQGRWLVLAHHDVNPEVVFECSGAHADLPRLTAAPFNPQASAISPADFRALATGEVVVVGMLRQDSDPPVMFGSARDTYQGLDNPAQHRGAWERFSPGSTKGMLEVLTWNGQNLLPCCVRMRSPKDVWIAGTTATKGGFAGQWDGSVWSFAAVDEPVHALGVEPDDTMWLATDTRVLRGALGHRLEVVPLPKAAADKRLKPESIAVAGAGDVWVTIRVGTFRTLYRTQPPPPYEPLPVSAEEKQLRGHRRYDPDSNAWAPSRVLTECESLFVTIFEIYSPPPEEVDYAAVAKALRGRRDVAKAQFIEYAHMGTYNFGARVPDAATGKKVVAGLSRLGSVTGAGKPNPKLVCFAPAALARVQFDFNAGTVASVGPP